jgi:hypothetical protein
MIEKKCKICGNFFHSRKIAMHYWNIHHKKYGEYKDNEETREVPDPVGEEDEKKTSKKTKTSSTTGTTEVEIQTTPIETETVQEGIVKVPETEQIPSPELWKETAHLFDGPVTNEARNVFSKTEKANPFDNGETINEWCN